MNPAATMVWYSAIYRSPVSVVVVMDVWLRTSSSVLWHHFFTRWGWFWIIFYGEKYDSYGVCPLRLVVSVVGFCFCLASWRLWFQWWLSTGFVPVWFVQSGIVSRHSREWSWMRDLLNRDESLQLCSCSWFHDPMMNNEDLWRFVSPHLLHVLVHVSCLVSDLLVFDDDDRTSDQWLVSYVLVSECCDV